MNENLPSKESRAASTASPGDAGTGPSARWVIPYIDQPLDFWQGLAEQHGEAVREVYFPLPTSIIGSGEPTQPSQHLDDLLRKGPFGCSVLLNPLTLPRPVEDVAPRVVEALRRLVGDYRVVGATVTNPTLARRVREAFPALHLAASCLTMISRPNQIAMIDGVYDSLVPGNRVMRDLPALKALKKAFPGSVRLIVNEACLPGCPWRVQHFHEMGSDFPYPLSLCSELLGEQPWLRLTGGWVLPQHLHLYEGTYDDLKLAGRVTLRNPDKYRRVLDAYIHRRPLLANQIGGGPASVQEPIPITEAFFANTLDCDGDCRTCSFCHDYHAAATRLLREKRRKASSTT